MESYLVALVQLLTQLAAIIVLLYAIMSFAPLAPWHPARRFLERLAEPILRPFRNLIPPTGMIDFTPMVAMLAIQFIGQLVILMIRSAF